MIYQVDQEGRFRGKIAPLSDDKPRPQWSVMIPTFNCAHYLTETLNAVLQQAPGSDQMQITVVDDCSEHDDPQQVVQALGGGRVEFWRQPRNQGVVGNLNTCLCLARGQYIHVLHGDDLVRPGFYAKLGEQLALHPEVGAVYCRHIYIDGQGTWLQLGPPEPAASGVIPDAFTFLGAEQRIMTPCIVVRREVYERLGGFDSRLKCAEDWEMWMRIAAEFPIAYAGEPLACYRMHANSNTGRNVRNALDLDHTRFAIELFSQYVPASVGRQVRERAFHTYARSAAEMARQLALQGDFAAMKAQLRVAWSFKPSIHMAIQAARICGRGFLQWYQNGR